MLPPYLALEIGLLHTFHDFFAFKYLSCPNIDAQLHLYIYTQNHHSYMNYLILDYSILSLKYSKYKYYFKNNLKFFKGSLLLFLEPQL
jgi:hypothetical protein